MSDRTRLHTSGDLKRRHKGHFFDPATLRFFCSKIHAPYDFGGTVAFVTSEQFHASTCRYGQARHQVSSRDDCGRVLYTVRTIDRDTGDIATVGDFQAFADFGEAQEAARQLARGEITGGTE